MVLRLTIVGDFVEAVGADERERGLLQEGAGRRGAGEVVELAAGLAADAGAEVFAVLALLNHTVHHRLVKRKNCIIKIGSLMRKLRFASWKWGQSRIEPSLVRSTRRLGPTGSGVALIYEIL